MPHDASITTASIAVLTVSDTRSIEEDLSGEGIIAMLTDCRAHCCKTRNCQRRCYNRIQSTMAIMDCNCEDVEVIIVTGGTGPSVRDSTPEAIVPMFTSVIAGFWRIVQTTEFSKDWRSIQCLVEPTQVGLMVVE